MLIYDAPNSLVPVPHGQGAANRLFLADVYAGRKAHYQFILLANSSRDARARLKKNALSVIKKLTETHWEGNYRTLDERTMKMKQILAAIKNNKIKLTELGSCRAYPVSHFDDERSVC